MRGFGSSSNEYSHNFKSMFFGEIVHTSLLCMLKISYQSKKLGISEKHLVEGSTLGVFFATFFSYFLTFQSHFANTFGVI